RAYRAIRSLQDARTFRGWLLSIAQAVVIDDARHGQRLKRSGTHAGPQALFGVADGGPTPDEQLEREETRGQVLAILRSLPEDYRLPLTMRYIGGADYGTIREQLGLSNGSLRGLLHRGLQMLRNKLEQAGKHGGAVCV
ncbi:MAG: sigma-70 family RNA polymerase sigma factor, partial [Planctomycetia bacterium]|nr:sigma-70 family RNA polymerase sigma factor [Planctomycetia bacterium]